MRVQEEKISKKRLTTSLISSIISTTLVLYLIGVLLFFIFSAKNLSEYFKENIGLTLFLNNNITNSEIQDLKTLIQSANYCKSVDYITKEEASLELKQELGEDFESFLGYNPLPPTLIIKLKSEYSNKIFINELEVEFLKNPNIKEVLYKMPLLDAVNNNINKISFSLLVISIVFLLISIMIINSTIRLSIYSKRFLIRSMLLVGSKKSFIRRPFLLKGIFTGFVSSIIAIILLIFSLFLIGKQIPEFLIINNNIFYVIIFGIILITGVLFSLFSTYIAVRKYIKIKTDNLYN